MKVYKIQQDLIYLYKPVMLSEVGSADLPKKFEGPKPRFFLFHWGAGGAGGSFKGCLRVPFRALGVSGFGFRWWSSFSEMYCTKQWHTLTCIDTHRHAFAHVDMHRCTLTCLDVTLTCTNGPMHIDMHTWAHTYLDTSSGCCVSSRCRPCPHMGFFHTYLQATNHES